MSKLFPGEGDSTLLLSETKALLRRFGLKARKGLGQHFLIDSKVLETIVLAAELTTDDTVIEVGPGLGILTEELLRRARRVISVELDEKLASILQRRLSSFDNLKVISGDILKLDPSSLVEGATYKVVANLPYYITSPVLRHFLEASKKPSLMVVMVQREVAEAIAATPGKMSLLSISVQFYARPQIVSLVPPESFYPRPEVDSAILKIELYPKPLFEVTSVDSFFELVRAGFTSPRKQIANSLAKGLKLPKEEILALLEKAGISPKRRAESLSLEEWRRLFEEIRC